MQKSQAPKPPRLRWVLFMIIAAIAAMIGLIFLHHVMWWGSFNCVYVLSFGALFVWLVYLVLWRLPRAWKARREATGVLPQANTPAGGLFSRTLSFGLRDYRGRPYGLRLKVGLSWFRMRRTTILIILVPMLLSLSVLLCGLLNH